jgi:DNA-directed RNA polymerase specialized sigma24 family protein
VAPPKVEERKVEVEEKEEEEESVKDAEYRPPVTSSRGVVSALDSLPPEEREKLLAARWVFDHSFQHPLVQMFE